TVPTDVITRLVTDEPPGHDDRAATELQALADQGVQIAVASGPGAGQGPDRTGGPDGAVGERRASRRDVPLPGQRRNLPPGNGGSPLRPAPSLAEGPGGRIADLAPRRR